MTAEVPAGSRPTAGHEDPDRSDDTRGHDALGPHGDAAAEGTESIARGSGLDMRARRALAKLLRSRFITRENDRKTWDALMVFREEIEERLADLFLDLVVDEEYEVAFKRQFPEESAPRMLRREKPLSREATLVLVHLRQEYDSPAGGADGRVEMSREQLLEVLRPARSTGDQDDKRFEQRVDQAINAVIGLGLLTEEPDVAGIYRVSPAVVPLIGADELRAITAYFEKAAAAEDPEAAEEDAESATEDPSEDPTTRITPIAGAESTGDDISTPETEDAQ
ncbi:DUF4194 domain-containing protein [Brevibacterium samyangense]|uniref:DUF4194 domain-containing protein n=1 Tax=Brevibacterium samyangense TaxID=366888 RepID=A0ABP5EVP2_9MICO